MVYCYNCSISLLIVNLLLRLIDGLKCITGTCVEEEDTLALGFHAPRGFGRPSTGGSQNGVSPRIREDGRAGLIPILQKSKLGL